MQLLLFTDIHRDLDGARRLVDMAQNVDAVIAAGDFASQHEGLEEMIDVLRAITTPTVAVPGNNETHEALTEACAAWPAVSVCHGSSVELAGVTFFGLGGGIPTTPWAWSYDLTEEEAAGHLAAVPPGAVLVVHSPPYGHLDGADDALFTFDQKRGKS